MKERTANALWIAGTAVVSLIGAAALGVVLGGPPSGWSLNVLLMSAILGVILVTFCALLWAMWRKIKDRRAGYPDKDERTKILEGRAAYYTTLASLYFMLALLWYSFLGVDLFDLPALNASQVLIASMLVSAVLFAGLRWYFLRKG